MAATVLGVAEALREKIPEGAGCISGKALGVSQSAALDYHGGIRTRAFDPLKSDACRLLLIQGGPKEEGLMMVLDPSGNGIEFKALRHADTLFAKRQTAHGTSASQAAE